MKEVDWDPEGERNPQNRGISKFERISWDEATDIIAKELKRQYEKYVCGLDSGAAGWSRAKPKLFMLLMVPKPDSSS
jgi:anaerobic selenocysteine-containing dehydrogenase